MISSTSSQSFRLKKSDMKHYKQLNNEKAMLNMNEWQFSHSQKKETDLRLLKGIQI